MTGRAPFRTRFAPSPTGPLHLGHAYSAMLAFEAAQQAQGQFFLRLDDIDQSRARPHWAQQIETDLTWLGITWTGPVWQQSTRQHRYTDALKGLKSQGLAYACSCNRADIKAAASAPQDGAPVIGPDGIVYPGTCRTAGHTDPAAAWRLNMQAALQHCGLDRINFDDLSGQHHSISAEQMIHSVGDVVLQRRGGAAAYHLAIVVDDADQEITHVIRGADLCEASFIHILLQRLLGLPTPTYHHHALVRDAAGKRLAKRDDARAIMTYREEGLRPQEVLDLARAGTML